MIVRRSYIPQQFITFSLSEIAIHLIMELNDCLSVPVANGVPISFYAPIDNSLRDPTIQINLVSVRGELIAENVAQVESTYVNGDKSPYYVYITINASFMLDVGECFRLEKVETFERDGTEVESKMYSNRLKFVGDITSDFSLVRYRCNEYAFGIPFENYVRREQVTQIGDTIISYEPVYVEQLLPVLLTAPQYGQDSKTYENAAGDVITLFAKYYKEWSGMTEYLPDKLHEKMVVVLSCDDIYIGGLHVTKTDNYQIEWDSYTRDCKERKLARATFKVRENISYRNSNYGVSIVS